MIFKNKRGQFVELTIALVFIVLFLVVAVFVYQAGSVINDEIQADTVNFNNQSRATLDGLNNAYPNVFDSIGMFIFVGLWIASLVAAYSSDGNPIYAVLAIIIIAALGFVSMALSNVWDEIESNPESSAYAGDFPMMDFIISNYLIVFLVMGFSTLIVALSRSGGGL